MDYGGNNSFHERTSRRNTEPHRSDTDWTNSSLVDILDLILGQSEEHGLTLHTLDEALILDLDISNLQFNDYFIVKNGELISSVQIPKEISRHDNPLWV